MIAGCRFNIANADSSTPTLYLVTSTLPSTLTPPPSSTPAPATVTSTVPPLEGRTTTQVNVRSDPSTASVSLGIIEPYVKIQVIGKDPSGNWYQIIYPQSNAGRGWVTAQYVELAGKPEVPMIG